MRIRFFIYILFAAHLSLAQDLDISKFMIDEYQRIDTKQVDFDEVVSDLTSTDPEIRRRGVLILGKLKKPAGVPYLTNALFDPEESVRLAAVVALTDDQRSRQAAIGYVLRLTDPSVHIRRMIASNLQFKLLMITKPESPSDLGQLKPIIEQAFFDQDTEVRRRMLQSWSTIRWFVDDTILYRLLNDKDAEVRRFSMIFLRKEVNNQRFLELTQKFVSDPASKNRLAYAEVLQKVTGPQSIKLLEIMLEDADANVRRQSQLSLFLNGQTKYWAEMQRRLTHPDTSQKEKEEIINGVKRLGNRGFKLIQALMQSDDLFIRRKASELLIGVRDFNEVLPYVYSLLGDEDSIVRKNLLSFLQFAQLTEEQVTEMNLSDYPDVRAFAVRILPQLPDSEERTQFILDALVDDHIEVRISGIITLVETQITDWENYMGEMLYDPSYKVARYAYFKLRPFRGLDNVKEIFIEYLNDGPHKDLKNQIQGIL